MPYFSQAVELSTLPPMNTALGLGAVEPPPVTTNGNGDGVVVEPTNNTDVVVTTPVASVARPWMLPMPIALQTFSIASGIAGGLAGFLLASRVQNSLRVSATQVMMATGLSILATFGAIFVIRTVEEWPAE